MGRRGDVRAALPLVFEFAGQPFRVVDVDGSLVAHSTICPHWLGPLDEVPLDGGTIRCPWHGYRFDVPSGACLSHKAPTLARAPAIYLEDGRVVARAT